MPQWVIRDPHAQDRRWRGHELHSRRAGHSLFPFVLGGEVARTFDGSVPDLMRGGFDAIGNRSQSTVFDIGAGTPGGSVNLFQTFTINAGVNVRTGEFFICAGGCLTANPFE